MAEGYRILPAGDEAILVELADLKATLALVSGLRDAALAGVKDLVPAARTVLISFDPNQTTAAQLALVVSKIDQTQDIILRGRVYEIPVFYDGEDLGEVAGILGWSVEALIERHTNALYTVAFTGFTPGFAYMVCDDPELNVPRRSNPRKRIPAGSVALAGQYGGIYPSESPGGWQLLGTTALKMWDTSRERAALLAPGDRVRFFSAAKTLPETAPAHSEDSPTPGVQTSGLLVTRADRPALYQDFGRLGHADQGVSQSGALDRSSLRLANLLVGNAARSAAIEIPFGGFAFRADRPTTAAVTGAHCELTIRLANGLRIRAPFDGAFAMDAGDELILDAPSAGVMSYLAIRGGFDVETVLGSASTDLLAKLGPSAIGVGSVLRPGELPASSVAIVTGKSVPLGCASETVTLDVNPGPRAGWFDPDAIKILFSQEWSVTADTSRIGMRLSGIEPLRRCEAGELASEGTVPGAIQVPHNGQPVVFLRDHPLTGGYPVIAVVATHHLDLAGQIPIGARVRFRAIDPASFQLQGNCA
ncbi:urea amidolyase family protein [Mesorhizobium sp. CCNWLW179-1]|uniref:5-oxoprolinase subunit B/C family protein n=1 Tax=unclassified Mesorhizobium TaxID=325217 RepID=UPI0030155E2D